MKRVILLLAFFFALTGDLMAGWLQIGENDRLVTYVQESPRIGKRYSSEKAQYEIDCTTEKARVLFFSKRSINPILAGPADYEILAGPAS